METITFECEVITPMFLAGADGKTPELRPPSIKGAMRFWWRAMNGHLSIEELREKESAIFGGSEGDGKKSSISIKVDNPSFQEKEISKSLWSEIPNQDKVSQKGKSYKVPTAYSGVAYLLYSTFMLNDREYVKSGTKRKIIINANKEYNLLQAVNSFWCLGFLGELGTRSRRGSGSIKLIPDKEKYISLFNTLACSPVALLTPAASAITTIAKTLARANKVESQPSI